MIFEEKLTGRVDWLVQVRSTSRTFARSTVIPLDAQTILQTGHERLSSPQVLLLLGSVDCNVQERSTLPSEVPSPFPLWLSTVLSGTRFVCSHVLSDGGRVDWPGRKTSWTAPSLSLRQEQADKTVFQTTCKGFHASTLGVGLIYVWGFVPFACMHRKVHLSTAMKLLQWKILLGEHQRVCKRVVVCATDDPRGRRGIETRTGELIWGNGRGASAASQTRVKDSNALAWFTTGQLLFARRLCLVASDKTTKPVRPFGSTHSASARKSRACAWWGGPPYDRYTGCSAAK